jgi:hypothetical protein
MLRRTTRVTVAAISAATCVAISLGLAASAPVRAADLGGAQNGYRGVCGPRFYNGVPVSFGYGLCYQQVLLQTPWGPRWRLVNQCC